ncbi:MAG: cryptochrome/photolyase family protein [Myxococcota bacterium]
MTTAKPLLLILGNQLFPRKHLARYREAPVFMAEDLGLCTYVRHHQQKIVLFLSAMRAYAEGLGEAGFDVRYHRLDLEGDPNFFARLSACVQATGATQLVHFEVEDKPFEARVVAYAEEAGLERVELPSPGFLCSRERFASYLEGAGRPFMATFYKQERTRLGLLLDGGGEPQGGKWSFDEDNRKKLPRQLTPPLIEAPPRAAQVEEVIALVAEHFADHPGRAEDFWWPTTRAQALRWLADFVASRLVDFGPYEDALTTRSATVFHSALSPLINLGLLTPDEVVERVVTKAEEVGAPLQRVEGFVRQVIGWREFIRGIYRGYSERQEEANFFGHERRLTASWWEGTTGLPPLDDTIRTAQRLGWTHHIPRLMVAANLMTLAEIAPSEAHRWFMEMYVDSSEWVMGPNVYGMGLFSDGGIFATKPYVCGSNYLRKMSDYGKGDWCDVVDGLYWRFIEAQRAFFAGNARLSIMPRALDRLAPERKERIFAAAEHFLEEHTA